MTDYTFQYQTTEWHCFDCKCT